MARTVLPERNRIGALLDMLLSDNTLTKSTPCVGDRADGYRSGLSATDCGGSWCVNPSWLSIACA